MNARVGVYAPCVLAYCNLPVPGRLRQLRECDWSTGTACRRWTQSTAAETERTDRGTGILRYCNKVPIYRRRAVGIEVLEGGRWGGRGTGTELGLPGEEHMDGTIRQYHSPSHQP